MNEENEQSLRHLWEAMKLPPQCVWNESHRERTERKGQEKWKGLVANNFSNLIKKLI